MKIIFQCYEIVSTLFLLEFSLKTPWKKRSYGESRKETGQISMRMRKRINVWMKRASRWNAYIYIYTHRNFIHGLRTEKAFASITIARREPRGDWNTRIFVELFFFFFLHREKVEKLHDTKLKRFLRARRIKLISNPTFHFRPARRFSFPWKNFSPTSFLRFLFFFSLPLSFLR